MFVAFIVFLALVTYSNQSSLNLGDVDCSLTSFLSVVKGFGRKYGNQNEQDFRFSVFQQNCATLNAFRRQASATNSSTIFGFTKFIDWTVDEKKQMLSWVTKQSAPSSSGTTSSQAKGLPQNPIPNSNRVKRQTPSSFDYRNWYGYNVVSPVENQGSCGDCWAFAATAVIESQMMIRNQSLYFNVPYDCSILILKETCYKNLTADQSEQQLCSCATQLNTYNEVFNGQTYAINYRSTGCGGGFQYNAFDYALHNGQDSAAVYPYQQYSNSQTNTTCGAQNAQTSSPAGARLRGYWTYGGSESSVATNIATYGPMSYEIWLPWNGTDSSFFHYTGGVYTPQAGESCPAPYSPTVTQPSWPAHAVAVVGYNAAANPPYWIIKNSWGTSWGMSGFANWYFGNWQCAMNQWMYGAEAYSY